MRPRSEPVISQSFLARARLRAIIIFLAPMVLAGTLGAAWLFNNEYQGHSLLREAAKKMLSASSYSAVGTARTGAGANEQDIRERFDYIAPDQASSRYIISSRQSNFASQFTFGECSDTSLVIQGSVRYRKCNDAGAPSQGWVQEAQDPAVFRTLAFQPWRRLSWCTDFQLQGEDLIGGVKTRIYACSAPVQNEAAELGAKVPPADSGARVDLTVWVREVDGYIGRFMMEKTWPGSTGPAAEKIDYVYSDFGTTAPIRVPTIDAGTGTTQKQQGAPASGAISPPLPGSTAGPGGAQQLNSGGALDFTPRRATIDGRGFYLEVASDEYSIARGLANRPVVAADSAMLFVLPKEDRWSFWMKDAMVPLDVLYLGRDLRIVDIHEMQPEQGVPQERLKQYQSRSPAQYAIEIKGGLARQYGFQVGDRVALE